MEHTNSSKETFRANVEARLEHLKVTRYAVSMANAPRGGWLGDILNPKRNPKGIPLDVLDEVGDALGVPGPCLLVPGGDMTEDADPPWMAEKG